MLLIVANLSHTFKGRQILQALACRKVSGNPGTAQHKALSLLSEVYEFFLVSREEPHPLTVVGSLRISVYMPIGLWDT